jgi:hypothetical protein
MKALWLAPLLFSALAHGQMLQAIVAQQAAAAPSTVAVPTFTYGGGTYNNNLSEVISDSTSLATICYTTDGSAPTATVAGTCDQNTYSTAITINTNGQQLRAIGTKVLMTNSAASANQTYSMVVAVPTVVASAGSLTGSSPSYTISESVTTATLTWSDATSGATINTATNASTCTTSSGTTNPQTMATTQNYCASAQLSGYTTSATVNVAATISAGTLPAVVHKTSCSASPCTITSTTAGNMLLVIGPVTSTVNTSDITAVSGNGSGSFTHATACNYFANGTLAEDAWYKVNITGGDTSITVTAGHTINTYEVYEVSAANTFSACQTTTSASTATTASGPAYVASVGNLFLAESMNSSKGDSVNSGCLPSSGSWTAATASSIYVGAAVISSANTFQFITNNHSGAAAKWDGVAIVFSN